jgi:hypothetical protein
MQRTLNLLRRSGYTAEICERWIPGTGVRRDLFHVGDLFAVHAARRELWLVQACTLSNLAARRKNSARQIVHTRNENGRSAPAHGTAGLSQQEQGGRENPKLDTLVKLARVLNVTFDELFSPKRK